MSDNELTIRFLAAFEFLKKMALTKSARSFADGIGISPSLISEAKKGRTNVKFSKIQKITEVFGVSKNWLLTGEGDMMNKEAVVNITGSEVNITEQAIQSNIGGKGNIVDLSKAGSEKQIQELSQQVRSLTQEKELLTKEVQSLTKTNQRLEKLVDRYEKMLDRE